jgi:NAD(P)-dependent dehydrogenase (short-subunit alcohol dehydrogenase family)
MMKLENRVAIVTGGGSGIGRAIALTFAREGARVVIGDIDLTAAKKVAGEVAQQGGGALAVEVDISKQAEVKRMVEMTVAEFKKVDILVNNAAYLGFSLEHRPFIDTDEGEWDEHINVTFKGTLHCCKAVIPYMMEQRWGRIINITSDSAKIMAPRGEALYSGCKAAVAGFSRCLAGELARYNILVNCVAPGLVLTPSVLKTRAPQWQEKVVKSIPLRRAAMPEDIANMVLFLASDEASYITGQHFSVDGGIVTS